MYRQGLPLGAEYTGVANRNNSGSVSLRFDVTIPLGSFAVWNGARAETFTSRVIDIRVPGRTFDEGEPRLIPKLGTWIIFSKIHEQFWRFGGPDGRMCQVQSFAGSRAGLAEHKNRPRVCRC